MKHLDVHVHLLPFEGGRGARTSLGFRLTRLAVMRRALKLDEIDMPTLFAKHVARLKRDLHASKRVGGAVLLAMDAPHDDQGRPMWSKNSFFIPDDLARDTARSLPSLAWGASIHPARRDAVMELERAAAEGAVLVKWLPNTMRIDPARERWRPFYRKLHDLGLPLLVHSGHEYSVPGGSHKFGDPERLRTPLDENVTVIAAHAASSGLPKRHDTLHQFLALAKKYDTLFADTSASIWNRAHTLPLLAESLPADRMLFGSDYPVIPLMLPRFAGLPKEKRIALAAEENWFDRHVAIQEALGVRPDPRAWRVVLPPHAKVELAA
ncbi:MAG: amidohydrolase family protein [Thermoplasmatota archaeon]